MKKKIILFTVFIFLTLILIPFQKISSAMNSDEPVIIFTVYKSDGNTVQPFAELNIYDIQGNIIQSGYTGNDGKVFFPARNLSEGKYRVRAYYIIEAKNIHRSEIEINFIGEELDTSIILSNK